MGSIKFLLRGRTCTKQVLWVLVVMICLDHEAAIYRPYTALGGRGICALGCDFAQRSFVCALGCKLSRVGHRLVSNFSIDRYPRVQRIGVDGFDRHEHRHFIAGRRMV
jgi:hypothetical protein